MSCLKPQIPGTDTIPRMHLKVMEGTSGAALDWQRFGYGAAVSLLVVILLTELLLCARVQAQQRKTLPPGPRPWPIVGNLPALAGGMPHLNLQQLAAKFGPLVYLRLGSVPCVVVSSAECARTLVRASDESLSSRPKMLSVQMVSEYKTMASAPSPGKLWHSLRRFSANELLSPKRVASYEGIRIEELSNMMQVLLEASNRGEPINLKLWLFQTAANLMTRMLVNKRIYYGDGANSFPEEVKEEFDQWLQGRKRYVVTPIISDYVPWLRFFSETVQGWRFQLQAFVDRQSALGLKMLELKKRRQRAAAQKEDDHTYVPDFVDVMLGAPMHDNKPLEDKLLIKQTMEFFSAGTETSSTTVEWALAELVVHPELMRRAQEEIDGVVGLGRLVHDADIPHLPFLQAIVKESFRLHPAAPLGVPRESTQPVEAFGYRVPAETRLIYNIYAVHRDPAVYENPDEFDPDRFLHRHLLVNHLSAFDSYELVPFGVGRRMCPGYTLGNTVVHFMLANLIHSYDWSVPGGGPLDMTASMFSVALCLKNPSTLLPKLRHGAPPF